MSGKGDGYRPVDREKFSSNWDRIFSKTEDREAVKHSEKQTERCDKTVDIEELIEASKNAEK
jgi:hypothetical protein